MRGYANQACPEVAPVPGEEREIAGVRCVFGRPGYGMRYIGNGITRTVAAGQVGSEWTVSLIDDHPEGGIATGYGVGATIDDAAEDAEQHLAANAAAPRMARAS